VPLLAEALAATSPPLPVVEDVVERSPPAPPVPEVEVVSEPDPQAGAASPSAVDRAAKSAKRADEEGTSISRA
jgi:hypothetical protein